MNRYIYHYSCRLDNVFYDGIAQLENRIVTHADLQRMKILIDKNNGHKMAMVSLSFLGMELDK